MATRWPAGSSRRWVRRGRQETQAARAGDREDGREVDRQAVQVDHDDRTRAPRDARGDILRVRPQVLEADVGGDIAQIDTRTLQPFPVFEPGTQAGVPEVSPVYQFLDGVEFGMLALTLLVAGILAVRRARTVKREVVVVARRAVLQSADEQRAAHRVDRALDLRPRHGEQEPARVHRPVPGRANDRGTSALEQRLSARELPGHADWPGGNQCRRRPRPPLDEPRAQSRRAAPPAGTTRPGPPAGPRSRARGGGARAQQAVRVPGPWAYASLYLTEDQQVGRHRRAEGRDRRVPEIDSKALTFDNEVVIKKAPGPAPRKGSDT